MVELTLTDKELTDLTKYLKDNVEVTAQLEERDNLGNLWKVTITDRPK